MYSIRFFRATCNKFNRNSNLERFFGNTPSRRSHLTSSSNEFKHHWREDKPKVLICGAGIGGLTCALALKQRGVDTITLIDSSDSTSFAHFAGQGILLQVNAMKMLKRLGVADKVEKQGQVINKASRVWKEGSVISNVDFSPYAEQYGQPCIGIEKSKLAKILLDAANLRIKNHTTVSSVSLQSRIGEKYLGNQVLRCNLVSGKRVTSEEFNVVVGADGPYSKIRDLAFKDTKKFKLAKNLPPWCLYQTIVDRPNEIDSNLSFEIWCHNSKLVVVPLGNNKVYLWGSFNVGERLDDGPIKHPNPFKAMFSNITAFNVHKLFESMDRKIVQSKQEGNESSLPKVFSHAPVEISMKRWVDSNVVLIGDAAHAFAPHYPQGAAMAIEDGFVLGNCIGFGQGTLEENSGTFNDARVGRVSNLQRDVYRLNVPSQKEARGIRLFVRKMLLRYVLGSRLSNYKYKSLFEYDPKFEPKKL